jgi:hypothetical protein
MRENPPPENNDNGIFFLDGARLERPPERGANNIDAVINREFEIYWSLPSQRLPDDTEDGKFTIF